MLIPNQGVILKKGTYPVNFFLTGVEIIGVGFDIRLNLGPLGFKLIKILTIILLRGLELDGIHLRYWFINKGN